MKKLFLLTLVLALLAVSAASAQTLTTAYAFGEGGYICSFTADNGQEIYYFSGEPQESFEDEQGNPWVRYIEYQDVNFDGHDDIVVMTMLGASNAFNQLFVWDGEQYTPASMNFNTGNDLPNIALHPEKQILEVSGTNGLAGMLHTTYLFRWEGTMMKLVRAAESDEISMVTKHGSRVLDFESDGLIYGKVYDCEEDGSWKTLWEGSVDPTNGSEEEMLAYLEAEQEALWSGL